MIKSTDGTLMKVFFILLITLLFYSVSNLHWKISDFFRLTANNIRYATIPTLEQVSRKLTASCLNWINYQDMANKNIFMNRHLKHYLI